MRTERNQDLLRRAFKLVTDREWSFRFEIEREAPAGTTAAPDAPAPRPSVSRSRGELLALPFVAALGETLGGQLMRTDDGFDPFAMTPTTPEPLADADPDTPTPAPPDPDET